MTAKSFNVLFAIFYLLACSAQTERSVRHDQPQQSEQQKPIFDQGSRIPPGHCRIVGTLVGIDSTLEQGGPCSKAPCRGFVQVDSILGYGSAFGSPLAIRKEINVRFAFTLVATTTDLFPNMTDRFPGLQVGARFEADVESRNEIGRGQRNASYVVYGYQKMN